MKHFASLFLLLAVACSREPSAPVTTSAADDNTPRDGGTILRRLPGEVSSLNPILAQTRYDKMVDYLLFTPMVHLNQDLQPIAGLADKWDIGSGGLVYTFHLNPKATFSDGSPVRASDVVYTLKKAVDPTTEAPQLAGGFEKLDLANTKVIDDHTVAVAFKEVLATQLSHFNDLMIVPEKIYSKGDFKNDFHDRAVGSGPYRIARREPGKQTVLVRREDYWGKKPYATTVVLKPIDDDTTAWNALKRGDVDETIITSDVWTLESKRPELQKYIDFRRFYYLNYNFIAWNNRDPVLSDKRVRRALAMCVDMKSVIDNLYHGTARAMTGPFTPDQWAYNPSVPAIEYDPDGARRMLSSVGWLDTNRDGILDRNGKPLKIDMLLVAGNAASYPFAQLFQSEVKKIGVDLNLVQVEPAAFFERVLAGNYQAAYLSLDLDPDPDPFGVLHSSQFPPKGQNFVFYNNPVADKLMDDGRRELDHSKRVKIYQQLHEVAAADQPMTWTLQVSVKWAINKRIHGVNVSKGFGLFLWYPGELDWWVEGKGKQRVAGSG